MARRWRAVTHVALLGNELPALENENGRTVTLRLCGGHVAVTEQSCGGGAAVEGPPPPSAAAVTGAAIYRSVEQRTRNFVSKLVQRSSHATTTVFS